MRKTPKQPPPRLKGVELVNNERKGWWELYLLTVRGRAQTPHLISRQAAEVANGYESLLKKYPYLKPDAEVIRRLRAGA